MSILKETISEQRLAEFFDEAYWFHTIELGNGKATKGVYDIRPIVDMHKFDASLSGKSVLDVGSSDGFYSFEFARRGADSVLALDTNAYDGSVPTDVSPAKQKLFEQKYSREREEFERFKDIFTPLGLNGSNKLVVLADYLDSIVKFKQHSIYDLELLDEKFDLVFCGGLFGHLKHPLQGIEQLRAVTGEKCIITVNGALPQNHNAFVKAKIRAGRILLRLLGVADHFSENEQENILKYVGNLGGGSFFHIHPVTFKEMLVASGFRKVEIVGDYEVVDGRINDPQRGCVFHCTV
jgi:2-polyprenyl-3-methyl-5-hydroxy-6-metoxy-1,4-benzoquinol methylase